MDPGETAGIDGGSGVTEAGRIGFSGLSHLGIVSSIAAAARGFAVTAFDQRAALANGLAAGRFPVSEPGLEEAFAQNRARLNYTADIRELSECKLIFISLDVPTNAENESDLASLQAMIEEVASMAKPGAALALMSQVPPGFCRVLSAALSGRLKLYYHVETLVFGNALERAVHPERYMIGCSDPKEPLPEDYEQFLSAFGCPVLRMRYESAELCKVAINCFLVSSVTTANTLAELCESIGADWSEITPALRLDRRIGTHAYLAPGLGIAGGNLERDLTTVRRLAAQHGCEAGVVAAWQENSRYRRDWVFRRLYRCGLLENPAQTLLGVWGLSYKAETHSTKNSPSLALLSRLSSHRWQAHDPAAVIDQAMFPHIRVCATPLEAATGADVLVIMTPWKQFAGVPLKSLRDAMRGKHILDPYGLLDGNACRAEGFDYCRLGA
jgi:UDPglucose 6-dehydrogenase